METISKDISKGDLEKPETEKIDQGRRLRISGSIESLDHHHADAIKNISGTDPSQGKCANRITASSWV